MASRGTDLAPLANIPERKVRVPQQPSFSAPSQTPATGSKTDSIPPTAQFDPNVTQLVVLGFASPLAAEEARLAAQRLHVEGALVMHDAVFITCDAYGKTSVTETVDESPLEGALGSAVWGILLGTLLGGPIGGLVGGAVAAGTGAVVADLVDIGIRDATITGLRAIVRPNTTSLALLVSRVDPNRALGELRRFAGASLITTTLAPNALEAVRRALSTC